MLNKYLQFTQRLIGDPRGEEFNVFDLIDYINQARGQVAAQGECMRLLTPITSGVRSVEGITPGAGYTDVPTVTVSVPDLPGVTAIVQAILSGTQIVGYAVIDQGSGYLFPPTITVSGGGAVLDAEAIAHLGYVNNAVLDKAVYEFRDVPVSTLQPGYGSILAVRSVAIIWDNVRYVGNYLSFSKMQALVRSYTSGNFLYTPFWFSQFGQGDAGSLYLYPEPDQTYPVEWDCLCLPKDLVSDQDYEAIPRPWTDAVPYYAAWLALSSTADPARIGLADRYWNPSKNTGIFQAMMVRARAFSMPSKVSSWYGRSLN